MNIKEIIGFTAFDVFYREYKPLSPYGLLNKNEYRFFNNENELRIIYESIGLVVDFIKDNSFKSDKIENHFKRIALLNSLDKKAFDSADIFLIKKLLYNYKCIVNQLDDGILTDLNISFSSENLLAFLTTDGKNKETFYLDASYDLELAAVREEIANMDMAVADVKKARYAEIMEKQGLDFRYRDFILVKEEIANQFDEELVYKEVYDKASLLVKPVLPTKYFELVKEKDILLENELEIEQKVLGKITERIHCEKVWIKEYVRNIEQLDVLFAKARLVIKYDMTSPLLGELGNIEVLNGRYLPLANRCELQETSYTPLNVAFDNKYIVLNGSNMGGKTVFLKTMGFLQLLAQMGFWVPARKFRTIVFENISYIGEGVTEKIEGLSSFGFEIHNLSRSISSEGKNSLLLIDEFGKTTNSLEAKALIAAMLKSFSRNEKLYCFLSTHFMELPAFENVSFYKMKGLNYSAYKKYYDKNKQYSLKERIVLINSFMEYEVVKSSNKDLAYDAIRIADTLGLNEEIIDYAKDYLKGNG
jgi:DNA mismatch repair protein MutS2